MVDIDVEKGMVKTFVRNVLFSKAKFLQPEDLNVTWVVSKLIRKELGYKSQAWVAVWETWAKKV